MPSWIDDARARLAAMQRAVSLQEKGVSGSVRAEMALCEVLGDSDRTRARSAFLFHARTDLARVLRVCELAADIAATPCRRTSNGTYCMKHRNPVPCEMDDLRAALADALADAPESERGTTDG